MPVRGHHMPVVRQPSGPAILEPVVLVLLAFVVPGKPVQAAAVGCFRCIASALGGPVDRPDGQQDVFGGALDLNWHERARLDGNSLVEPPTVPRAAAATLLPGLRPPPALPLFEGAGRVPAIRRLTTFQCRSYGLVADLVELGQDQLGGVETHGVHVAATDSQRPGWANPHPAHRTAAPRTTNPGWPSSSLRPCATSTTLSPQP